MDADLPLPTAWSLQLSGAEPADAVLLACAVPLVGRVWLACLPAGLPGRHAPRDLPATWAASLLLGSVWIASVAAFAGESSGLFLGIVIGVPALAATVLAALAPAALVPRHEPEPLRASAVGRALVAAAVLASAILAGRDRGLGAGVEALASSCLAHAALLAARVPAFVRALALAAVAAAVGILPSIEAEGSAALGAAGAGLGLVTWIRRGDRRGLALVAAAVLFLALTLPSGGSVALAVAIATPLGSVGRTRWRALVWSAAGLAAGVLLRSRLFDRPEPWCCGREALAQRVEPVLIGAVVLTPVIAAAVAHVRARSPWNPSGAPRGREALVLGAAALLALLLQALQNDTPSDPIQVGFPQVSAASASFWVLASMAVAIGLARALEGRPSAR
ncbi:MAG: hypothetical protein JNK02_06735 [Planctomycetes bacterium]|nr:hypothetical protein [Planctomycetota bacterium]